MSKCTATTKKGTACKAAPLTGTDRCLSHSDAKTRKDMHFVGGRKPNPRSIDLIRERIEQDIDSWMRVLLEARDANKTVQVGYGENAYTEVVPDHGARLAAFREAHDRAYGRPKQQTELTGADGGPVLVTFDQLAARAASGE